MSVEAQLDQAFTTLLAKAQQRTAEQAASPTARTASIIFEWGGGRQPITSTLDPLTGLYVPQTDPLLVEVPFDSTIVWAHMFAGDGYGAPVAVTAAVAIAFTQFLTFGSQTPLNGTGTQPRLQTDSIANVDLTNWHINLLTGDALIARLDSFSGVACWVALTLQLRATQVQIGVAPYVDTGGSSYVDASGNPYVFRT